MLPSTHDVIFDLCTLLSVNLTHRNLIHLSSSSVHVACMCEKLDGVWESV